MNTALNPHEHRGSGTPISPALRTEALEQLLTERGHVDPAAIDELVTRGVRFGATHVTAPQA